MSIANIIRKQIGSGSLFMLGAKNLVDVGDGLSFRIRGSKAVNYIKITLNSSDLYDMEFGKIHGHSYKLKATHTGVYVDMLKKLIQDETGLATNA